MRLIRRSVRQVRAERIVERREEKQRAGFEVQEREDDVWTRAATVAVKIILLHRLNCRKSGNKTRNGDVIIATSAERIAGSGLKC